MEVGEGHSDKFSIRHIDGNSYDRVPFVSQKDFENFYSFPAEDGMTYGVVLQAKKMSVSRIEAYTANNLGKHILPRVNGHPLEVVKLYNQPIKNGVMFITRGFSAVDLLTLAEVIPPTPEQAEFLKHVNKNGIRILSAEKTIEKKEEEKKDKNKDSQGRKIISEQRGRL